MSLRVDPFGPNAVLVRFAARGELDAFTRCQALLRYLEQHPPVGLLESTPGMTTLLLEFEPGHCPQPEFLGAILADAARLDPDPLAHPRTIEVPVIYDGQDLDAVAARAGLPVSRCVELHAAVTYRVQILGFCPGFPYLSGLDRRLHVPRLDTPRTRVPAGSVAIGGEHTGIYPVSTAGGWNLIGRTDLRLLDPEAALADRRDAFTLHPGDLVRFVPVRHLRDQSAPAPHERPRA